MGGCAPTVSAESLPDNLLLNVALDAAQTQLVCLVPPTLRGGAAFLNSTGVYSRLRAQLKTESGSEGLVALVLPTIDDAGRLGAGEGQSGMPVATQLQVSASRR